MFLYLSTLAIAMGILEAIVVVYLRELYYPSGFHFPLQPIPERILLTEMLREVCIIVMIVAVTASIANTFYLRLSYFLFIFGAWDIFYYVGLKVLLDWPPDLLTWDILFLIPVTWAGPVLAPLVSAITMIVLGIFIYTLYRRFGIVRAGLGVWLLMGLGALIIFLTYTWDYSMIIIKGGFFSDFFNLMKNPEFQKIVSLYVPGHYNWYLFALGEILIIAGAVFIYRTTSTVASVDNGISRVSR